MKHPHSLPLTLVSLSALASVALAPFSFGGVEVKTAHSETGEGFSLDSIPPPAINDFAAGATFSLADGRADGNGATLAALHDGQVPTEQDQPTANFFFAPNTNGGRIAIDLGEAVPVEAIRAYSWHPGSRGPQVFTVFGADGNTSDFDPAPSRETDPADAGWRKIAEVDTRSPDDFGGQHAVAIRQEDASPLGNYRYLLFDVESAGPQPSGNTFFSEIDVVRADGEELIPVKTPEPIVKTFPSPDGKYTYTFDATQAPDLAAWAETEMIPVVQEWYPKLVEMLPSEGFVPLDDVVLEFRPGIGPPAYASGNRVTLKAEWFREQLEGEALGCVVHELTHVVQSYYRYRRQNPNATQTPVWLREGVPDYIRWFLYEPETQGALITSRNLSRARYDASYRISANFLNWVVENHDRELIRKINAAARAGTYSDQLWIDSTGMTVEELGAAWKAEHEARLSQNG